MKQRERGHRVNLAARGGGASGQEQRRFLLHLQRDLQQTRLLCRCADPLPGGFEVLSEQGIWRGLSGKRHARRAAVCGRLLLLQGICSKSPYATPLPESGPVRQSLQVGTNREHVKAWAKNFLGLSAGVRLACSHAPSTMLRMVPLPRFAGEDPFGPCGFLAAKRGGGERSERRRRRQALYSAASFSNSGWPAK